MGNHQTMFFSLRCLLIRYPIQMLTLLTISISFTFAYMMRVIEGPVYYILTKDGRTIQNDYRSIENTLWNIFVIMTTVGYGDYFPYTNLGRFIMMVVALSGIILISLIIISLQDHIKLNDHEAKVNK